MAGNVLGAGAREGGIGMDNYVIEMVGERRADGSVMITSPKLPMFSAVGENERAAFDTAVRILREYLSANVPEFVDLTISRPTDEIITWTSTGEVRSSVLPAHVIAVTKGRPHGQSGSANS